MEVDINKEWIKAYMVICMYHTSRYYTCNRPPGPSGAMISPEGKFDCMVFGYTEPNKHLPTCKSEGCDILDGHCVRAIHAEQDAIFKAAKDGIALKGAWIFSILKPCYRCTQAIVASGITKIFYAGTAYDDERTKAILEANNIECTFIDIGLGYG